MEFSVKAVLLAIGSFVALGIAGFVLNGILTQGWSTFSRRMKVRFRLRTESHLPDSDDIQITSRFAATAEELEDVLALRLAFFGRDVLVPDDTYRRCWQRNPFSMKIVYYLNKPLGYWSVIPIEGAVFEQFLAGSLSHDQMLTQHCRSWSDIQPDNVYLYIIGAVVPTCGDGKDKLKCLLQKLLSAQVVYDMYSFAHELSNRVRVKGVCGYPSRTGGYSLLKKTQGFEKSATLIDDDEAQPVFVLKEPDVPGFQAYLQGVLDRHPDRIPKWEESDRNRFFGLIATPVA